MPQKCLNEKSETVKGKVGVNGSVYKAIFFLPQLAWLDPGSELDLSRENIPHLRRALKVKLRAIEQKSSLKSSQHLWGHGCPPDAFSSSVNNITPPQVFILGEKVPAHVLCREDPPLPKEEESTGPGAAPLCICLMEYQGKEKIWPTLQEPSI